MEGYKIPFERIPSQNQIPNVEFASSLEEQRCAEAIEALIVKSAIRPCQYEPGPFLSPYLIIPIPDDSYIFIFNLYNLNSFISNNSFNHFKMEDIRTAGRLNNTKSLHSNY